MAMSSLFDEPITCKPSGKPRWVLCLTESITLVAAGTEIAGSPARLAGIVITSFKNISTGSDELWTGNGVVGVVGVNNASICHVKFKVRYAMG